MTRTIQLNIIGRTMRAFLTAIIERLIAKGFTELRETTSYLVIKHHPSRGIVRAHLVIEECENE